jgi:segregation and condensation protein B
MMTTENIAVEDDWEYERPEVPMAMPSEDAVLSATALAPLPQEAADPAKLKGFIEAALFVTNRPLKVPDLVALTSADMDSVEEALMGLMQDYSFREGTALEIDDSDGYMLQIKEEFRLVQDVMLPMELTALSVRTLSTIAIQGPLMQSELAERHGSTVYDAIRELQSKGLVRKNRVGRSYKLTVTQKFNEYFKLVGDKDELKTILAMMDGEAPERVKGKPLRLPDATDTEPVQRLGATHTDIGADSVLNLPQ